MKKRRGAGNRGGRGMAGSGKRGDAKKPSVWKTRPKRGKKGFNTLQSKIRTINLAEFSRRLDTWVLAGKARKSGDIYEVNLSTVRFDKLLGAGAISQKVKVIVSMSSAKAAEKIKAAGGEILSA